MFEYGVILSMVKVSEPCRPCWRSGFYHCKTINSILVHYKMHGVLHFVRIQCNFDSNEEMLKGSVPAAALALMPTGAPFLLPDIVGYVQSYLVFRSPV